MAENKQDQRMTHGVYSLLRKGKMPSLRGIRRAKKDANDLEIALRKHYGGKAGELTPPQEALAHTIMQMYRVSRLIELFINQTGVPMRPGPLKEGELELQPVLAKNYIAYANTMRQNLMALEQLQDTDRPPDFDVVTYARKTCATDAGPGQAEGEKDDDEKEKDNGQD